MPPCSYNVGVIIYKLDKIYTENGIRRAGRPLSKSVPYAIQRRIQRAINLLITITDDIQANVRNYKGCGKGLANSSARVRVRVV